MPLHQFWALASFMHRTASQAGDESALPGKCRMGFLPYPPHFQPYSRAEATQSRTAAMLIFKSAGVLEGIEIRTRPMVLEDFKPRPLRLSKSTTSCRPSLLRWCNIRQASIRRILQGANLASLLIARPETTSSSTIDLHGFTGNGYRAGRYMAESAPVCLRLARTMLS